MTRALYSGCEPGLAPLQRLPVLVITFNSRKS